MHNPASVLKKAKLKFVKDVDIQTDHLNSDQKTRPTKNHQQKKKRKKKLAKS